MAKTADRQAGRPEATAVRTFLIADVRGYTRFTVEHGDASGARLAARFAEIAKDVVAGRDGEVIELRGDEALAVFISTRQALRAAVELQGRFMREMLLDPSLPLRVGIGVDAGEAIPVAGGYRGASLNLAARLCALAGPGDVLVSETVISLARKTDGLTYIDRGAADLKGFAEPISIFNVTLETSDGGDLPAVMTGTLAGVERLEQRLSIGNYLGTLPGNSLVGREAELERAQQVVDSVLAGNGRFLVLAGEAGAGKTRLAQEITLNVRNHDCIVAAGRCYESQQSVPFYPFVDALTALYVAAPAEIQRMVPRRWPDVGRLLPTLGLPVPDSTGPPDQQRLFWAVTDFVRAVAAESPVALLLDDLHCADSSSLEVLQHLTRHTDSDRVLILGTFRDVEVNRQHPLEGALRDLHREGLIKRIDVRRLDGEDTAGLIASVLGEEDVGDEFAELVYRRTEGNAFFVVQVLRALVERGDVFPRDGVWDRKSIDQIEVPDSVRSVVGQRLSRLHEETQEILREASILGQTFTFDDLATMSGCDERALEVRLEEAIAAGMVRERSRDVYGFDHALTQGTLYAELTGRRRRRLHLAAGEAIERLPEAKRAGRAAELAWHFLEGNDSPRAMQWSLRAGDAAEAVFAHNDAEYQYRTAGLLAREEGDETSTAEAVEKLGRVLFASGRLEEARETFEEAIEMNRSRIDVEGEIRVTAEIGWVLFDQARREEGLARLLPVLERWERTPTPSSAAASLHIALANLYWNGGRNEEGLPIVRRAIELAGAVGDNRLLGVAEARHAALLQVLGHADEGAEALSRSIALSEEAGDLHALARSLHNRALSAAGQGRWDLVRPDQERHLEIAQQLGNPREIALAQMQLMYMAVNVEGDMSRALQYAREIIAQRRILSGTRGSFLLGIAMLTQLLAGEATVEQLEELKADGERSGDVMLWGGAQSDLAFWDELHHRGAEARERLTAILADPGLEADHRLPLVLALARTHLLSGDIDESERLITACLSEPHATRWPLVRSETLATLAMLRAGQGRWDDAEEAFEAALTHVPAGGFETAITLYRYGLALVRKGDAPAARERLDHALALFAEMGLKPLIALTERALANL